MYYELYLVLAIRTESRKINTATRRNIRHNTSNTRGEKMKREEMQETWNEIKQRRKGTNTRHDASQRFSDNLSLADVERDSQKFYRDFQIFRTFSIPSVCVETFTQNLQMRRRTRQFYLPLFDSLVSLICLSLYTAGFPTDSLNILSAESFMERSNNDWRLFIQRRRRLAWSR